MREDPSPPSDALADSLVSLVCPGGRRFPLVRLEERDHSEDATMVVVGLGETQLGQDARDVLLHRPLGDPEPSRARLGSGSGLEGLVDRVEALGGRLTIESPPARGTRILAVLPLGGVAEPETEEPAPPPEAAGQTREHARVFHGRDAGAGGARFVTSADAEQGD